MQIVCDIRSITSTKKVEVLPGKKASRHRLRSQLDTRMGRDVSQNGNGPWPDGFDRAYKDATWTPDGEPGIRLQDAGRAYPLR